MKPPLHIALVFNYNLEYPRRVLRGIKQFVQTRPDWSLVPFDIEGLSLRTLRKIQPTGLIAQVVSETLAEKLRRLRRPVVNVATVVPDLGFPRVGVNHELVGRLAASHLRELGLRQFGFVGHPMHFYSTQREAGFRQALALGGASLACYHDRPAPSHRQRGHLLALNERLQRWLQSLPKPVGVFACHDIWGLQVVEACRLAGVRVPDEVAVISVDNDDLLCELARPSLSSIIVPGERVGFEAAALLERLLKAAKPPRKPLLFPPVGVVTRESSNVLAGRDPDVTAAMRYIRDHAHVPLSVKDVLLAVPVSRRSLERRFRALLERGLGEEIRRVHMERAKDLLAMTALSMTEVAEQSGFASVHYWCRVFRQETGLTPTAYRRQIRNPTVLAGNHT